MAHILNILVFLALCVLTVTLAQESQGGPHTNQGGPPTSQGGPHENQGRSRREATLENEYVDTLETSDQTKSDLVGWTTCNFAAVPKISCHDCTTRMICKSVGGLLKACNNPFKPHCNNGICSPVPSAECA